MASRIKLTLLIGITLASLTSAINKQLASAQDAAPIGFTVSPAIIEVGGKPGTTVKRTITLDSTQDAPIAIQATPRALVPIDQFVDKKRRDEYDASAWFTLSSDSFILEPGKPETAELTIAIPASASPGGHYASIAFRPMESAQITGQSAEVVPEIEALTLITIPGAITEQAELDTNDVLPGFVTAKEQPTLRFKIRNTGNVHVLTNPKLTIRRGDDIIDIIALAPQLVLPGTEKVVDAVWQGNSRPGVYTMSVDFSYGAQAVAVSSAPIRFIVWPNLAQAAPVAVLLFIGLFILFRRRNLRKAILALAGRATHRHVSQKTHNILTDDIGQERLNDELLEQLQPTKVLGLPVIKMPDPPLPNNPPATKPLSLTAQPSIQKTTYTTDQTTTHIIQTKASTIVRSTKPVVPLQTTSLPRKITVIDHSEIVAKKASKKPEKAHTKQPQKSAKPVKTLKSAEKLQK